MDAEVRNLRPKELVKGRLLESPKDVLQTGQDVSMPCISFATPNFDANTLCQPKVEGSYHIDPKLLLVGSKIGEGAHGKVYEGRFHDLAVAVKVIQVGETQEEVATARSKFAREVSMLSKVRHKNLVKFIGACEEPMVLVTELLSGQSLRKYLLGLRPQSLDLSCAISFALDIAQVMDCLHVNGIIHRDLKPDNLLLTADQKTVKLVDFGLAREETVTEMMTAETGTYRWMAPELYSTVTLRQGEKKHYNQKVDVYSFGIVLWELLTNKMPFEGMSNLQAAYAAAFKCVRPAIPESFPEELVFILQACWSEDPNVRPSFSQVVRMLMTFWSSLPPPRYTEPQSAFYDVNSLKNSCSFKDSPRSGASREPLLVDSSKYSTHSHPSQKLRLVASSRNGRSLESKGSKIFQCFGQCFEPEVTGKISKSI